MLQYYSTTPDPAKSNHGLIVLALLLCSVIVLSCTAFVAYYLCQNRHVDGGRIVVEDDGLRLSVWDVHFIGDNLSFAFCFEITRQNHPWVLESPWYVFFTYYDVNGITIGLTQKEIIFPSHAFVTGRVARWESEMIISPLEGSRAFMMQLGRSGLKTTSIRIDSVEPDKGVVKRR